MTGYDLSRAWFNFCFENPELIKPIHSAIFFFAVEHQNRLGGKEKFGFPSQMTMEAIGVKKHQTYSAALNDLEEWGFIVFIERSKNQYSANIISIALPENGTARDKALDKATIKHSTKQGHSTGQSKDSINKPINQEPLTNKPKKTLEDRKTDFKEILLPYKNEYSSDLLNEFFLYWTEHGPNDKKMRFEKQTSFDPARRLITWKKNQSNFGKKPKTTWA